LLVEMGYKNGSGITCRTQLVVPDRPEKESAELAEMARPIMEELFHALEALGGSYAVVLLDVMGMVRRFLGCGQAPLMLKEGSRCDWAISALEGAKPQWQPFHLDNICESEGDRLAGWSVTGHPVLDGDTLYGILCVMTHSKDAAWIPPVLALSARTLGERWSQYMKSQLILATLLESMPVATVTYNKDGTIQRANQAFAELCGIPKERLPLRHMSEFFSNQTSEDSGNWATGGKFRAVLTSKEGRLYQAFCISSISEDGANGAFVVALFPAGPEGERQNNRNRPKKSEQEAVAAISFSDIVGDSPEMQEVKRQARRAAGVEYNVLLLGKSGVGKEMIAQAIHTASRPNGPFVAINCGAITKELLGSELFGYEEGAFTGARRGGQIGKIVQANHGTLFLDEIGEMSLDMQVLLLRVLETSTVVPIGGLRARKVDVRVIAATNRDLLQNVISGKFRDDLYYRLNVIKITIPNLSTRQGDVTLLAKHFLAQIAQSHGLERIRISPEAMEALNAYRWPGNVRQLKNTLESAFTNAENAVITLDSLPATIRENINYCVPNKGILQESEKMTIEAVLQRHGGNVSKAATELGISRTTLYNKISRFGITL